MGNITILTDAGRIKWLEERNGNANLVADDAGNWAVSDAGFQPVSMDDDGFKETVTIACIVEPEFWKPSIREAIDYAAKRELDEMTKDDDHDHRADLPSP